MPYIIGAAPASSLNLSGGDIKSGVVTTTTTDATALVSLDATAYRSAYYQIQIAEGSTYNTTNVSTFHDGTTAYVTEYGTLKNGVGIATFDADVNAGQFRLIGYSASSGLTTFRIVYTAIDG